MAKPQVLITGAGPTGLVLALYLTAQNIPVRIIDKAAFSPSTSRALAVQPRTLELYQQLGLADVVLDGGHRAKATNLWVGSQHRARIPVAEMGKGITPFPFIYIYPQDKHERALEERLAEFGVAVERGVELKEFVDYGDCVKATLSTPDGDEDVEFEYVVGCDGGRSTVRESMEIGFEGGTYPQVFFVADIEGSGHIINGEIHIDVNDEDYLLVFGLKDPGTARLVGVISGQAAEDHESLTFADVSHRAIDALKINVTKVNWFSTYRVHHRVAEHFRQGRVFLVGDAAHVHSPAGGQGMNTGIGDAINLAWKLASVLKDNAEDSLLDTYEAERRAFAQTLVSTTDRAFTTVTSNSLLANIVRTRIAPAVAPLLFKLPYFPAFFFRRISQTLVSYRSGPLAEGYAGYVHGGDRLPWASVTHTDSEAKPGAQTGPDNYTPLPLSWHVHVYGSASDSLAAWCKDKSIPLRVSPWDQAYARAGLVCGAAYLIRPDTYIGAIDSQGRPEVFAGYFSSRGIRPVLVE